MLKRTVEKLKLGFKIGDYVSVDNDKIYGNYSQFVKLHRKYATRYQYKTWTLKNNAEGFKVVGVHNHVMKDPQDKNKYVVVVEDSLGRLYLFGETGVKSRINLKLRNAY